MSLYVQSMVSGILLGGLFALMALGFSLTWKYLRIINLAHFGVILLSAYLTYHFASTTRLNPWLALVFAVPLFALAGFLIQWVFDYFKVSVFNSLLLTFGMFIIIEGIIRNIWGADLLRIGSDINPYSTMAISLGGVSLRLMRLIALSVAIPFAVGAALFLERSYLGKALRAMAEDPSVAAAFGVNYRRISSLLAAAAGATGAIAGVLVALRGTLSPNAAEAWIGVVFAVVILGGVGSPTGAVVAAMLIGAVSGAASIIWGPSAAPLVAFMVLILVLLWRPHGLFGKVST